MEVSNYDRRISGKRRTRKHLALSRKTLGRNPQFISANGEPMVMVNHLSFKKLKAKVKTAAKKVGGGIKQATKATGKGIAKGAKATGKGVKKGVKVVAKVAKGLALAPMLAPLVPLMPLMGKALKKKGFTAPKKIQDRAEAFYTHVIKGNKYDAPDLKYNGYYDHDNLVTVEIVGQIIKFIKDAIDKKKASKNNPDIALSPDEALVATETEAVVGKIQEAATEKGIDITPKLPGSNAKESNESGVADGDEPKNSPGGRPKGRKASKNPPSDGKEISFKMSPFLIGGIILVVFLAFRK